VAAPDGSTSEVHSPALASTSAATVSSPGATSAPSAPASASPAPAPSAPPSASATSIARRPCRVALIGDSLTENRAGGGGYVRYLRARSPRSHFENFGKGGAMVNQMKRQLEAMLADTGGPFTHLVVFGGVNDLYSDETAGRTVAKIQADLGTIYAAGRARGLRVVGITVAPWGGFNKYYNERRARTTRELNAWILDGPTRGDIDVAVDAYALLSCGDPERLCPRYAMLKSDGLHFGKLGHEALGAALYDAEFKACA
jgi:lysophospholipase L1-like esterase